MTISIDEENMIKRLFTFCAFLLPTILFAQEVLVGTVNKVYNGDSFTILAEDGTEVKIVAMGIDAPELPQEYGIESRDYARDLLLSKKVNAYLMPGEFYGRREAIVVTSDNIHFSYHMVSTGNAWWDYRYSKDKYLEFAHKSAASLEKGLWKNPRAQPPWDWSRSKKRKKPSSKEE